MNESTLFQGTVIFAIGNVDTKVSRSLNHAPFSYRGKVQSLIGCNRPISVGINCTNCPKVFELMNSLTFRCWTCLKMEKRRFQSL